MANPIIIHGADELKRMFREIGDASKRAVPIWQNSLGEHAQGSVRGQLPNRFTFRGTRNGFQQAVILAKATQSKPAELKVGSASSTTRTGIFGRMLARHEEAQTRTGGFYLPAKGIRTASANPPRWMYPKAILANPVRKTKTKGRGQNKVVVTPGMSFLVTEKGIFGLEHSVGLSNTKPKPIWWFQKRVRTPERSRVWATSQDVINRFASGYGYEAISTVLDGI